jgi:hypothetical protein
VSNDEVIEKEQMDETTATVYEMQFLQLHLLLLFFSGSPSSTDNDIIPVINLFRHSTNSEQVHPSSSLEESNQQQHDENQQQKRSGLFTMLFSFLKHLKPGTDLTNRVDFNIEAIEAQSGLEYNRRCLMQHSTLLINASQSKDAEKRIISVAKFLLSTVRLTPSSKKPLNPILGELAIGRIVHAIDGSETVLVSEQVSHHPPISATIMRNNKHGIELYPSVVRGSATFLGTSVHIKLIGEKELTLTKFNEKYKVERKKERKREREIGDEFPHLSLA